GVSMACSTNCPTNTHTVSAKKPSRDARIVKATEVKIMNSALPESAPPDRATQFGMFKKTTAAVADSHAFRNRSLHKKRPEKLISEFCSPRRIESGMPPAT